MKTCSKCKQEKPATSEYFIVDKRNKSKIGASCKTCHAELSKLDYKNNRDKRVLRKKEYAKTHRTIMNSRYHRRVAKQKGNGWEPYTEEQMLSKYGSICYLCNEEIDFKAPRQCGKPGWERSFWIEHVVPVSKGGPDTLDNVRPSHGLCNLNKSNKEPHEKA